MKSVTDWLTSLTGPNCRQTEDNWLRTSRRLKLVPIILALCLITACGGGGSNKKQVDIPPTAEPGAPKWEFGSNAVTLRLRADNLLNSYENQPHTLVLCIYMLSDPNGFLDLAKNKEGVIKLLGCQRFSDTVVGMQRVVFQPGEVRTVQLDRAERTKYVALAAGYFDLVPDKATRLLPIPVDVATEGWIFKSKYQIPGKLDVYLFLGSNEIREGGS